VRRKYKVWPSRKRFTQREAVERLALLVEQMSEQITTFGGLLVQTEEHVDHVHALQRDYGVRVQNLEALVEEHSDRCNARHEWTSGMLEGMSHRIDSVITDMAAMDMLIKSHVGPVD
jgi:hypothetical protein